LLLAEIERFGLHPTILERTRNAPTIADASQISLIRAVRRLA
jgi:hypothetical protein